ncbi:MAG: hypothetical protein WDO70_02730 [Alphaproteobacteria bacterium]
MSPARPKKIEVAETESDSWELVARAKGYKCSVCAVTPFYDERVIYYATKMCGWCAHQTW